MTRFAAITVFGLFGMAILFSAPPPAAAEHRFETKQTLSGSRGSAGSFEVAQKAPLSEAEKRKRRQQKKKASQARKRQQQRADVLGGTTPGISLIFRIPHKFL